MPTVSLYDTHNNAHRKVWLEAHDRERPRTKNQAKLLFLFGLLNSWRFEEVRRSAVLVAPQGFEPRLIGSEPTVLPLNEGATD